MADKRELLLIIRGKDQGAKKALDDVGDAADGAKDDLDDMNRGLKKLDGQIADSTQKVEALRREIAKSGDLGLVKDLEKAQRELNKLTRQRKLIIPVELDVDKDKGVGRGADAAAGFAFGFSQRIGPLMAKAPLSPPLLVAIAAASPAIVGILGAAISGGAALGAVGIGVALAAQNEVVRKEGAALGEDLMHALVQDAGVFVTPVLESIDEIRAGFGKLRPDVQRIFTASAAHVPTLTKAISRAAELVVADFADIVEGADPVVEVLSEHIPKAADAASEGLKTLSKDSEGNAKTLDTAFTATEQGIGGVTTSLALLAQASQATSGIQQDLFKWITGTGDAEREAAAQADELARAQVGLIGGYHLTAEALNAAADAARSYADANRTLTDQNLSVAESTVRYKEAIIAARDEVDKKKKVSLEEEGALLSQARASNTLVESLDRQGASAAVLAEKHRLGRKELIETATRMGYTKEQAALLADQYLATPRLVNTQFTADTDQAARNLREVRDLIAAIKSKKVVITVDRRGRETTRSEGRNVGIGDGIGGRAAGGPVTAGQAYVVGDGGRPEVFVPDRNGTIIPSIEKFQRGMGKMSLGGAGATTVRVLVSAAPGADSGVVAAVVKSLRFDIRTSGQDSQTYWAGES